MILQCDHSNCATFFSFLQMFQTKCFLRTVFLLAFRWNDFSPGGFHSFPRPRLDAVSPFPAFPDLIASSPKRSNYSPLLFTLCSFFFQSAIRHEKHRGLSFAFLSLCPRFPPPIPSPPRSSDSRRTLKTVLACRRPFLCFHFVNSVELFSLQLLKNVRLPPHVDVFFRLQSTPRGTFFPFPLPFPLPGRANVRSSYVPPLFNLLSTSQQAPHARSGYLFFGIPTFPG